MRAPLRLLLAAALAIALPGLSGCGKKPKLLDPPEDAGPEAKQFPHTYPNPKYEPVPPSRSPGPATATEPLRPDAAYPPTIRTDTIGGPSNPGLPGQGTGGWPDTSRSSHP